MLTVSKKQIQMLESLRSLLSIQVLMVTISMHCSLSKFLLYGNRRSTKVDEVA